MSEEDIGYVKAWATKWDAVCGTRRCGWTIRKPSQSEATDSLRLHAALVHPQPIRVTR